ncbi:hypothetical protein D770_26170 [Flammeovirgaceae bacterium 311]|nr:hypothetical protein D770_26170 [Flammeovirgaceae bacterium 311]
MEPPGKEYQASCQTNLAPNATGAAFPALLILQANATTFKRRIPAAETGIPDLNYELKAGLKSFFEQ